MRLAAALLIILAACGSQSETVPVPTTSTTGQGPPNTEYGRLSLPVVELCALRRIGLLDPRPLDSQPDALAQHVQPPHGRQQFYAGTWGGKPAFAVAYNASGGKGHARRGVLVVYDDGTAASERMTLDPYCGTPYG